MRQPARPSQNTPIDVLKSYVIATTPELSNLFEANADTVEEIRSQYRPLSKLERIRGAELEDALQVLSPEALRDIARHHKGLLGIIDSSLRYYEEKGLDDSPLLKALTHLVNATASDRFFAIVLEAVASYQERGWRLSKLIDGCSALATHKVSPTHLSREIIENFGIGYAWLDIAVCDFDRQGRVDIMPVLASWFAKGVEPDAIFPCCSLLARTPEAARFVVIECCNVLDCRCPSNLRGDFLTAMTSSALSGQELKALMLHAHYISVLTDASTQSAGESFIRLALQRGASDIVLSLDAFADLVESKPSQTELAYFIAIHRHFMHDSNASSSLLKLDCSEVYTDLEDLPVRLKRVFLRMDEKGVLQNPTEALRCLTRLQVKASYQKVGWAEIKHNHPDMEFFVQEVERQALEGVCVLGNIEYLINSLGTIESRAGLQVVTRALEDARKVQAHGLAPFLFLEKMGDFLDGNSSVTPTHRKLFREVFIANYRSNPISTPDMDTLLGAHSSISKEQAENIVREFSNPTSHYTPSELLRATRDATVAALVDEIVRRSANGERTDDDFGEVPWVIGTKARVVSDRGQDGKRMSRMLLLHSRLHSIHRGFAALAADAERKHTPDGLSMIERIGNCLGEVLAVHATTPQGAPIKAGLVMSRVDLKRVFAPDLERQGDPFHEYKEAWPLYSGLIDGTRRVSFIPIRNGFWISAPRDEGFNLHYPGVAEPINYSLVIFNEHYESVTESAFLVKTSLLYKKLAPCLYDPQLDRDATSAADFNSQAIDPHSLRRLNEEDPLAVIDVGSGRNLIAGHAVSFDLRAPHFSSLLARAQAHSDLFDHYGYPDYLGQRALTLTRQEREDFNSIDSQVASITERGLGYLDLYLILLSQGKKGYIDERTHRTADPSPEDADVDSELLGEVALVPYHLEPDTDDLSLSPSTFRLLEEARRYRQFVSQAGGASGEYRVLALCDTLNLAARPRDEVYLDTESGVLSVDGIGYLLDLDSPELSEADKQAWLEYVMPKLHSYFTTLRFFRKESLLGLEET